MLSRPNLGIGSARTDHESGVYAGCTASWWYCEVIRVQDDRPL